MLGEPPGWSFQVGLDEDNAPTARVWLLANGLIVTPPQSDDIRLYGFFTEPDLLVGYARAPFKPVLFSAEHTVHREGELHSLEAGNKHAALISREDGNGVRFALSVSDESHDNAVARSQAALDNTDLQAVFEREVNARTEFWAAGRLQSDEAKHLRAHALETLIAGLRLPEGPFDHHWIAAAADPQTFSLNELAPLVWAWTEVDPRIAESLLRTALSQQQHNGFIPAWVRLDGQKSDDEFVWPALITATYHLLHAAPNEPFSAYAFPRLSRYLLHGLDRFSVDGQYAWTNPDEAFIPELCDEGLCTVDLAALLCNECEQLLAWEAEIELSEVSTHRIREQRRQLIRHVTEYLWNPATNAFTDRFTDGQHIRRSTISTYFPLMFPDLPASMRKATLDRVGPKSTEQGLATLSSWDYWDGDPEAPPIRPLHLFFVLNALILGGETKKALWFSDYVNGKLAEKLEAEQDLSADLRVSIDKRDTTPRPPATVTAALAIATDRAPKVDETQQEEGTPPSPIMLWLDRYRVAALSSITAAALIVLLAIVITYLLKPDPTGVDMEELSSVAERYYEDGRYEEAIDIYMDLAEYLPHNPALHLRLGNALHRAERWEKAEFHYRKALDVSAPSPLALRNLAVTLHKAGNNEEAIHYFERLIDEYGEFYPELAAEAQVALDILQPNQ